MNGFLTAHFSLSLSSSSSHNSLSPIPYSQVRRNLLPFQLLLHGSNSRACLPNRPDPTVYRRIVLSHRLRSLQRRLRSLVSARSVFVPVPTPPPPFLLPQLQVPPLQRQDLDLLEGRSLFVTTSPSDDQRASLNNVTVNRSLIYVDGSFIIFGMDEFFDPLFRTSESLFSVSFECAACIPNAAMVSSFHEA
jgi:hypothetical protein